MYGDLQNSSPEKNGLRKWPSGGMSSVPMKIGDVVNDVRGGVLNEKISFYIFNKCNDFIIVRRGTVQRRLKRKRSQ